MSDTVPVQSAVAVLHVFSGVHLGARIELTAGSWLLGSDDACDLILNGLAARHAQITVQVGEDGAVSVTALPQEGPLLVDGVAAETETPLQAGTAWYLGETCFAWNLPGVRQEEIIPQRARPVLAADSASGAEAEAAARPEPGQPEAVAEGTPTGVEDVPATEGETDHRETPPAQEGEFQPVRMDSAPRPPRVPWRKRLQRPVPLLILAVLLCVLSFAVTSGPSRSEYPDIVNEVLHKAGITGLMVTPHAPGVEVRGAVPTSADLERLNEAVQDVSFPVFLEVAVDDDMIRAVRNALGLRGFSPVVSMERGGEEPRLRVTAFMRDSLVEADAFFQLENDVPSPPAKERHIVYEKDVAPLLLTALQNAGLGDMQPVYLPGRISLTGNMAPDRAPTLNQLKSALSARFGVPLFGEDMLDKNAPPLPTAGHGGTALTPPTRAAQATPGETKQDAQGDPLGGLKLTGVFTSPLTFVTTEDGRRLFKGAVLPNGNVLENITTTGLTLRRGDVVFTYTLRGNHE